jgi:hypothetical protein
MSIEQKIAEILAESNANQFSEEIEEEFEDLEELDEEDLQEVFDRNANKVEKAVDSNNHEKIQKTLSKVPTDHLHQMRHFNMGQNHPVHPAISHVEKELNKRKEKLKSHDEGSNLYEEEQLDELSKEKLRIYVDDANQDKEDHEDELESAVMNKDKQTAAYDKKRIEKRKAGINMANKKLAKEEYDLDISEDVAALTNGEELSEEFKAKAATIFEAAVINRVKQEVATLEEEFDARLEEAVAQTQEALVEKVDGYLNYVVETWMVDNELALERGMKSEILESFVSGMKGLFEEHYIDVPEEKFDLIGEMEEAIESLNGKLDEQLAVNVEMKKLLDEAARVEIVSESCEGLTDTEKEKFVSLVEELSYENSETFEKKVQTIRENYFTNKATTRSSISSVVTDEPVSLNEEKVIPAGMKRYVQALNNLK